VNGSETEQVTRENVSKTSVDLKCKQCLHLFYNLIKKGLGRIYTLFKMLNIYRLKQAGNSFLIFLKCCRCCADDLIAQQRCSSNVSYNWWFQYLGEGTQISVISQHFSKFRRFLSQETKYNLFQRKNCYIHKIKCPLIQNVRYPKFHADKFQVLLNISSSTDFAFGEKIVA